VLKRSLGILGIGVALVLVVLGATRFLAPVQPLSSPEAGLQDLASIDDLKARFNADMGVPRIILLVSPT
jgi:hypothetical protein